MGKLEKRSQQVKKHTKLGFHHYFYFIFTEYTGQYYKVSKINHSYLN